MAPETTAPRAPHRRPRVLVLSLAPYRFATRARKAARALSEVADVAYLAPAAVGRTGTRDEPGQHMIDGIRVTQVPVAIPRGEPTVLNQVVNLCRSYLPALVRLAVQATATPADVVFVNGPPLAPVGWLHRRRHHSAFVLDVNERPGMVSSKGSLFSVFARFERGMLHRLASATELATVATYADLATVRTLGFPQVVQVRNAPLRSWRVRYRPPLPRGDRAIRLVVIGSVFEGRGYELLLEAFALAAARVEVRLDLYGPGRDSYLRGLRDLTIGLGIDDRVGWRGTLNPEQVCDAYLDADIGLVLYDPASAGNDGLSNKILECVASGRPVIATDLPENRRFVESAGCGWLTGMTAEQIAQTIVAAATAEDYDEIVTRCRRLSEGGLSWENDFEPVKDLVVDK